MSKVVSRLIPKARTVAWLTKPVSARKGYRKRRYMGNQNYVGIDIAKDSIEVTVHEGTEHWAYTNDESGLAKLVARMKGCLLP